MTPEALALCAAIGMAHCDVLLLQLQLEARDEISATAYCRDMVRCSFVRERNAFCGEWNYLGTINDSDGRVVSVHVCRKLPAPAREVAGPLS